MLRATGALQGVSRASLSSVSRRLTIFSWGGAVVTLQSSIDAVAASSTEAFVVRHFVVIDNPDTYQKDYPETHQTDNRPMPGDVWFVPKPARGEATKRTSQNPHKTKGVFTMCLSLQLTNFTASCGKPPKRRQRYQSTPDFDHLKRFQANMRPTNRLIYSAHRNKSGSNLCAGCNAPIHCCNEASGI